MLKNHSFPLLVLLVCAAVILAACERPASNETLPTEPPDGVGGGGEGVDLAATETAVAVMRSLLFAGQTQTVQAGLSGVGGGDGLATATPTAPPLDVQPTATTVPVVQATATPAPVGQPTQYTVQPGDWLYKIARDKGVTPQALIAANPHINPNAILQPGTVLTIPAPGVPIGGGEDGGKTYLVKPGDNLFRIALNHGTTYQVLAQLNNIPAPYTIFPGQVIKLP